MNCFRPPFWFCCTSLLIVGCAGEAPAPAQELPLATGFYVDADTACGAASNATLALFLGDSINGARDTCRFTQIEQTGPGVWQVTEQCAEIGDPASAVSERVEWRSTDSRSFRRISQSGWEHAARLCPQAELPPPWRDNDIG